MTYLLYVVNFSWLYYENFSNFQFIGNQCKGITKIHKYDAWENCTDIENALIGGKVIYWCHTECVLARTWKQLIYLLAINDNVWLQTQTLSHGCCAHLSYLVALNTFNELSNFYSTVPISESFHFNFILFKFHRKILINPGQPELLFSSIIND